MNLLLDTHVWLWMGLAPGKLAQETQDALADLGNTLWLSAASTWEMAIKYSLGRLPLPMPPAEYVPPRLIRDGVQLLPITMEHTFRVGSLPHHHRDPFDRLLVAQALSEKFRLVSVDAAMSAYDVETL